jgi:hypothetical protein
MPIRKFLLTLTDLTAARFVVLSSDDGGTSNVKAHDHRSTGGGNDH